MIMDKNARASNDEYLKLKSELRNVLSVMTPFEQNVLKMRFGLDGGRSFTLEDVGVKFNITIERIRRIEVKALRLMSKNKLNLVKDVVDTKSFTVFQKNVLSVLSSLPKAEQEIVKVKYGLKNGIELSDEDLIKKLRYYRLTKNDLDRVKEKVHRRINHKPDNFINITMEE